MEPILSIIISNRNDVVMLNQTVRSAQEAIVGLERTLGVTAEIVIADNSDPEQAVLAQSVIPQISQKNGEVVWLQMDEIGMAYARMEAARKACGKYLFCCDGHMLFGRDTLSDLVTWMEENQHRPVGFAHAPINWGARHRDVKRYQVRPKNTLWGAWWNKAPEYPHLISWKWMPWICNRNWYLDTLKGYGCLGEKKVSWGGAELLQQNKSWLMGYENWGIPTDAMIHLGPYSLAVRENSYILTTDGEPIKYKYRLYGTSGAETVDGYTNYWGLGVMVAFYVLCGDEVGRREMQKESKRLKEQHALSVEQHWESAMVIGKEERDWFKTVQIMTYDELMTSKPWE